MFLQLRVHGKTSAEGKQQFKNFESAVNMAGVDLLDNEGVAFRSQKKYKLQLIIQS